MSEMKVSSKLVPISLGVLGLIFLISFYILAWQEPTQAPPGGNVPAPLHTGAAGQAKAGGLILNTGGASIGLIVQAGDVGIGTTAPGARLDVRGRVNITGILDMNNQNIINVNKISVNTVDPVFQISGKKYATYFSDMIGQKSEVVGEGRLQGKEIIIDLATQPEGSDLWLFWQIVDSNSIIPFVSPQDEASLYAYMEGSKFVVKLREGKENAKFSFRLIGTRLDFKDKTNHLYEDQDIKTYIDIDALKGRLRK